MEGVKLFFGTVAEIDMAKGKAKVVLPEENITTHFMPLIFPGTNPVSGAWSWDLQTGDAVAVLMSPGMVDGVVIGAYYNAVKQPQAAANNGLKISFTGAAIENDGSGKILMTAAPMEVSVKADGIRIKSGGDSLAQILSDLIDAMALETHVSAPPGSPTSPPVNAAAYTAIKTRLNLFLKS